MKKQRKKSNVYKLPNKKSKTRKRASPTLPKNVMESEAAQLGIEYLTTPEEDSEHFILSASDCYELYSLYCSENGVKPLTIRRFRLLAKPYVRDFKGERGLKYYEVRNVQQSWNDVERAA